MKQPKPKKCKGTGRAINFGCGVPKLLHKFGLCRACFGNWLYNTTEGKIFLESTQIRAKKHVQKEQKKEQFAKKVENRSKPYFEKKLEFEINSIVRLIDSENGCISCNHGWETNFTRQAHSGHRFSVGSNPTLRYNLFNIWKQCSICNNWKSGNEREYDKGIITHFHTEILTYIKSLPAQYKELHLSFDELKQAIINARSVKKEILSGIDYSREEINKKIGIYE
jgi:hypothetical protein